MTVQERATLVDSPTEYQALVMVADGQMRLEPRQITTLLPGQVVIDVTATGICGSDVHGLSGTTGRRKVGQVMGHETAGVVVDVGPEVDPALLGERVTINPVHSCGLCAACLAGQEQQCETGWVLGVRPDIDAAFANRVTVPASNIVILPPAMPTWHGALVEPLAVGYHAVRRGDTRATDRVLVIGGGPIGQAVVVGCRREGVEALVVTELDTGRSDIVRKLGAPVVLPERLDHAIDEYLNGAPTLVFDAVGSSETLRTAVKCSQRGARIVLVGMASPTQTLDSYDVSVCERAIIGTFCYSFEHFRSTVAWLAEHPDLPDLLVDRIASLDDGPDVFNALIAGTLHANKVLLSPLADLAR